MLLATKQNKLIHRARCVNANAKETVEEFADVLCSNKFNNITITLKMVKPTFTT